MQRPKQGYSNVPKQINTEQILGRTLPAHIGAEKSVIGALLLNNELAGQVAEILLPDDFYNTAHKLIFQTILQLEQQQKKADIVTLQDELTKQGYLDTVGGIEYLLALQEDIPSLGLVSQHAKIIK